jgi:hypothetical protein
MLVKEVLISCSLCLEKCGEMAVPADRNVKVWIFITLSCLLYWIVYWIPAGLSRISAFVFASNGTIFRYGDWMYLWMELSASVATIVRIIGVLIGFSILFLFWHGGKGIFEIKKWLASALVVESFYYAMVGFPSGIYMMGSGYGGQYRMMGVSFFLQFLFTTPLLAILAIKVYRYEKSPNGFQSWKWVGAAFVGYIAALFANSVLKWFEMVSVEGIAVFPIGIRAPGALSAFVLMSLALVFAVVGAFSLVKRKSSAIRWLGLALALVGLHYLVFVAFSYFSNILNFAMLAEVWTIPLLGLGLSMLRMKNTLSETK